MPVEERGSDADKKREERRKGKALTYSKLAGEAKVADALDLGSSGAIHVGSTPIARTNKKTRDLIAGFFMPWPLKDHNGM